VVCFVKGGNAFFTVPNSPIKCIGAAQKIMYLAEETWRTVRWIYIRDCQLVRKDIDANEYE
jgi:sulfide:quinone oxidoreductase